MFQCHYKSISEHVSANEMKMYLRLSATLSNLQQQKTKARIFRL